TIGAAACRLGRQYSGYALDARDVLDDLLRGLAERFQRGRPVRRDGDREVDLVIAQQDLGDEAEVDDVAFEIGPLDALELFENLGLCDRHLPSSRGSVPRRGCRAGASWRPSAGRRL